MANDQGRLPPLTKLGPSHGGGVRGDGGVARSSTFEGRFGRIFRSLPAAQFDEDALLALGTAMTADPEKTDEADGGRPLAAFEDPNERIQDDEENPGIAAGYTYLGQFIDHDLTFDPASSLQQQNDVNALVDYRTPRLDLDSLYGRGPDDQPYMYDGKKFRLGRPLFELKRATKVRDLPRYRDLVRPDLPECALIGDKRNDENVIIAQLHAAMLQFHNKLVDLQPHVPFELIQRQVRWHYQWIVVNDFLTTICGEKMVDAILPHREAHEPIWEKKPEFALYKWRNDAFMPIEFSAAAFRFGHSMVRPIYRLNTQLDGGDRKKATDDEIKRGLAGRQFIFAGVQKRGLGGFGAFPDEWAIDWSLFFDIDGSLGKTGKARVQPAYKLDTALVNPLGFLPEFSEPAIRAQGELTIAQIQGTPTKTPQHRNLAQRNLLRGARMGLPTGQDVARAMGLAPIPDEYLRVGKAIPEEWEQQTRIKDVHPSFAGAAPLWYYVLAEAHYEWIRKIKPLAPQPAPELSPQTLGPVGGRIVAETLVGLLWADGHSYLRQCPNFQPTVKDAEDQEHSLRTMGELIKFALS